MDASILAADFLASSRFTYVEMRAALASSFKARKLARSGDSLSQEVYDALLRSFDRHWRDYVKINLSPTLLVQAGHLAGQHYLSGSDAVQLSSALALRKSAADEVRFSVSDTRLRAAAISEGFVVI